MWSRLRQNIAHWQGIIITAPSIVAVAFLGNTAGLFQMPEIAIYDHFMNWRPQETADPRITVVTIDESDLDQYNFPIPDHKLAQAIKIIKQQKPRAIGLDIYRDLPVNPGYEQLIAEFATTDNLIGIEKVIGKTDSELVDPPHTIPTDRVAFADLVADVDGKIRRALLSIERENGEIQLGLGAQLALIYLAEEGIFLDLENQDKTSFRFKLGKATIKPFSSNDGGYVKADTGGYQIFLNYRGWEDKFNTVPLRDILEGKVAHHWGRDQIILIGATAESLNDKFYTPYHSSYLVGDMPERMAGVLIHANITSQLISAALEGRPLIQVLPEFLEWGWVLMWGIIGASMSWLFFKQNLFELKIGFLGNVLVVSIIIPSGILVGVSYWAFLQGWWLPVFTPFIALTLSALAIPNYKNYELYQIACKDSLTQISNRRYFDQYYPQIWHRIKETQHPLSVILCDVDFFKLYNDTYGHQAGDRCLQQVAQAITKAVRSTDLVARYGGEEFIIVLPSTDRETAYQIGQRICFQVQNLNIPHQQSQISSIVTLSCGVATSCPPHYATSGVLIAAADSALYEAKAKGRNCAVVC
ncbi:diguanylate cyclase with Chase2 sensor [Gloeothece citriformis PCC 7424]|uniref:Diguanylate cyclase with Chase2 sensor n=2 Tax=Gloeothece TaxID=28070 RepID=B7KC88_GLOC7|nr:diguanylate cyclase with Chase2 sensor [Gloeothece citriformis PCC 7424]